MIRVGALVPVCVVKLLAGDPSPPAARFAVVGCGRVLKATEPKPHVAGQINIVDKKTLISAQENPEEYSDLIVRVAGFSAYFVDLSKGLQDHIIARTEQNLA